MTVKLYQAARRVTDVLDENAIAELIQNVRKNSANKFRTESGMTKEEADLKKKKATPIRTCSNGKAAERSLLLKFSQLIKEIVPKVKIPKL